MEYQIVLGNQNPQDPGGPYSRKPGPLERVKRGVILVLLLAAAIGILVAAFVIGLFIAGLLLVGVLVAAAVWMVMRFLRRKPNY